MFFIFAFYPFITIRFNITAVSLALFTRCRFYMRLNNEILMKFIFLSFCKDTYIIILSHVTRFYIAINMFSCAYVVLVEGFAQERDYGPSLTVAKFSVLLNSPGPGCSKSV